MKTRSEVFQFEKELKWEHPAPGIRRQIMGYDGQLMMVKVEFEKGAVGTLHEHYHSQATYVASGKFELTIGDRKEILSTGDGYYVAPDESRVPFEPERINALLGTDLTKEEMLAYLAKVELTLALLCFQLLFTGATQKTEAD